jgi:hypothetical protein
MKSLILIVLIFSSGALFGFDELFEYKLKHEKNYNPGESWIKLNFDDSFALEFESEDSFIRVGTCLEKQDGNFYIIDNNLHKFVAFNENGKFLKKVGQIGKGPGDLYCPYFIRFFKNRIFIHDNNGFEIFGKDFNFLKRIRTFLIIHDYIFFRENIYCVPIGSYKENNPLILKLGMDGSVQSGFYDERIGKSALKNDRVGYLGIVNDNLIFIPTNWNMIYVIDENLKLRKKIQIKYGLLDDLEKWNNKSLNNKKGFRFWFANMIASVKTIQDRIYVLLDIPRLEIIQININGNIEKHFYNDVDFRFMRWTDFTVEENGNVPTFYIMGYSIGKEKKGLSELGVYKLILPDHKGDR